jgi:hypothetical protein
MILALRGLAGIFLAALACVPLAGQTAAGSPQLSREEQERFLLDAQIVNRERLSQGITGSQRATLSDGRLTHDAHIQSIDEFTPRKKTDRGIEVNFRDSYKFNIAAYRLDKLLGLNMVPVSVERKVGPSMAAVTWWVDDVLMQEKDRFLKGIDPPDTDAWNRQMYQARVFNQLVANTDPNLGNFLITKNWKLWTIDFTRGFRTHKDLLDRKQLTCIDPRFHEALKTLTEESVRRELESLLSDWEMEGLLARRRKVVEFFDRKAAEQSQAQAFCAAGR